MVAEMGFEPMHKEGIGLPGRALYQSAMKYVMMNLIFLIIYTFWLRNVCRADEKWAIQNNNKNSRR